MELVKNVTSRKGRAPRILVVEDDLELSVIIEGVLRGMHSTLYLDWVTSSEKGIENLKQIRSDPTRPTYDLIIIDIFLEGKSTGIDFWKLCLDLLPDIPVVITSALSLEKFFSITGKISTAPPYLQKPFTLEQCQKVCEEMLKYKFK